MGRKGSREEKEEVGEVAVCRLSLPAEPGSPEQNPSLPTRGRIRSGCEGSADQGSRPQLSAVRPTEFTLLLINYGPK